MAVLSRSIVLLLQFVVNNVIRDYDTSSSIGTNNNKLFDKPLHFVLQGFSNWDSICGKSSQENLESGTEFHSPDIFVYIVHLLFLTVFAVTSIHVQ
ncbi:hypothetical protein QZH41_010878, partial [Actinostola sp. cb2023]